MNPVRILLWVAIAAPLLAFWTSQGEAAVDWPKEVERACTAQRYGLRLAAAKKVASTADSMPAIRAFAQKHGANALPATLIEAIADQSTLEAAVWEQLIAWSKDRDFYWRAQALRGLALRAPKLPGVHDQLRDVLAAFRDDRAWLMRTHARFGLVLLGDHAAIELAEDDPRARVRLASLLLGQGIVPPLQPLIDALADERTFLGDPWGQRMAGEAHKALKTWLGEAHPLPDGTSFADRTSAIAAVLEAVRGKSGQTLRSPAPAVDPAVPFAGGFEALSCKNGDLFVQWTANGEIAAGIDARVRVVLPADVWKALNEDRARLSSGDSGVVVCDSLRLRWTDPELHVKVAPGSLPAPSAAFLERFAKALADADNSRLADDVRTALEQFAAR